MLNMINNNDNIINAVDLETPPTSPRASTIPNIKAQHREAKRSHQRMINNDNDADVNLQHTPPTSPRATTIPNIKAQHREAKRSHHISKNEAQARIYELATQHLTSSDIEACRGTISAFSKQDHYFRTRIALHYCDAFDDICQNSARDQLLMESHIWDNMIDYSTWDDV